MGRITLGRCRRERRLQQLLNRGKDRLGEVVGIESVEACADTDRLLDRYAPPPAEQRDAVEATTQDVLRVKATYQAGRYAEALELSEVALKTAEEIEEEQQQKAEIAKRKEAEILANLK